MKTGRPSRSQPCHPALQPVATVLRGATDAAQLASELLQTLEAAGGAAPDELHGAQRRLATVQQRLNLGPPAPSAPLGSERGGGGGGDALGSSMRSMAPLDYAKVRDALVGSSDDCALVLQALRWRITKPPRRQRKVRPA